MLTPFDCRASLFTTLLLGSFALAGCTQDPAENARTGRGEEALSSSTCPDDVPGVLTPDADQRLWFVLHGVGVQIYTCTATAGGYAWVFKAPRADLLNDGGQVVGTHYAGPTWQSIDGSTVVAAVSASAPSPDPDAIRWLLLTAVSHSGNGRMTNVTAIQRLSTEGGLAPTTGCDADHVGDDAEVPYTADYFFYETGQGNPDNNPQCGG